MNRTDLSATKDGTPRYISGLRFDLKAIIFDAVLVASSLLLLFLFPHGIPVRRIPPLPLLMCYAATAFIVPVYLGSLSRSLRSSGTGVRKAAAAATILVDVFLFGCFAAFIYTIPSGSMSEESWIAAVAISFGGLIWGILIGALSALPERKRAVIPRSKKYRRRAHTDTLGTLLAAVVLPLVFMAPGMIIAYLRLEAAAKDIQPHYLSILLVVLGIILLTLIAIAAGIGTALGIRGLLNFLTRSAVIRSTAALILAPLFIALALFFWYQLAPFIVGSFINAPTAIVQVIAVIVSGILPVRMLMLLVPPIRMVNVVIGSAAVILSAVLPLLPFH